MRPLRILALVTIVLFAGCGDESEPTAPADQTSVPILHPDVVDVVVTHEDGTTFEVAVTLSSPYDTPERYADAWRVLDGSGAVLGVRELLHDHAGEQPFTRRLTVEIPPDVSAITAEGRDQFSGWGGDTRTVDVPHPDG